MTPLLAHSGLVRTSQHAQQDLTCSRLSIPFYNCIGCSKHTLFFYDTYLPPSLCYTHHPIIQHGGGGNTALSSSSLFQWHDIRIASSDQVQRQQRRDEPVRENTHLVLDTLASRLRSYHLFCRS